MISDMFGISINDVSENKEEFNIKFGDLSDYIVNMTEDDFNVLLEKSGLSKEEFIEKLIEEGWSVKPIKHEEE